MSSTPAYEVNVHEAQGLYDSFTQLYTEMEDIKLRAPSSLLFENLQSELGQLEHRARDVLVYVQMRDAAFSAAGFEGVAILDEQSLQCSIYGQAFKDLSFDLESQKSLLDKLRNPCHHVLSMSGLLERERSKANELGKKLSTSMEALAELDTRGRAADERLDQQFRAATDKNHALQIRLQVEEMVVAQPRLTLEEERHTSIREKTELQTQVKNLHKANVRASAVMGANLGKEFAVKDLEAKTQSLKQKIVYKDEVIAQIEKYRGDEGMKALKVEQERRRLVKQLEEARETIALANVASHSHTRKIDFISSENEQLQAQLQNTTKELRLDQKALKEAEEEEKHLLFEIEQLKTRVGALMRTADSYKNLYEGFSVQNTTLREENLLIRRQIEEIANAMNGVIAKWGSSVSVVDSGSANSSTQSMQQTETPTMPSSCTSQNFKDNIGQLRTPNNLQRIESSASRPAAQRLRNRASEIRTIVQNIATFTEDDLKRLNEALSQQSTLTPSTGSHIVKGHLRKNPCRTSTQNDEESESTH